MLGYITRMVLKRRMKEIEYYARHPELIQTKTFRNLLENGQKCAFGREHGFATIQNLGQFQEKVPLQNYENLKPYIQRITQGEKKVLWPSPVRSFAMSSGTTNDKQKYIPITKESLFDCHYKSGKDMLAMYIHSFPSSKVTIGKSLTLGGSQQRNTLGAGIYTGDLSAVVINSLPFWAEYVRIPNARIALLPDWEEKMDKLCQISMNSDVVSMAGVPSWLLVLLKKMIDFSGKSIPEIWPNLEVFFHGGVSFGPYQEQYNKLIPQNDMSYWETYNASEGFFGIQYTASKKDMLLLLDHGIFYEFIPMTEYGKPNPHTIPLSEVKTGINYALVISTNGGLWRYLLGDTVTFTSTNPYLIKVTGRTKHFINAFGEELIIDNAEAALQMACSQTGAVVNEYTAAPIYFSDDGNGAHEWIIEFSQMPSNLENFQQSLDEALKKVNSDYEAKRSYNLSLGPPQIIAVEKGTFYRWMKSKNKLGGQNKAPRLSNDRKFVEEIKNVI